MRHFLFATLLKAALVEDKENEEKAPPMPVVMVNRIIQVCSSFALDLDLEGEPYRLEVCESFAHLIGALSKESPALVIESLKRSILEIVVKQYN